MPAHEHLNHEQLSMFIPAKELMDLPSAEAHEYDDYIGDSAEFYGVFGENDGLMGEKRGDNSDVGWWDNVSHLGRPETLDDSVHREGVHTPVSLRLMPQGGPIIWNGHHRIIAAYDANPDMEVPVKHVIKDSEE